MSRPVVYWDLEGEEQLTHTNQDEAIEYILDDADELSGTIEICGYARLDLFSTNKLAEYVLEHILKNLDEEYSDPEGNCTNVTTAMREAAKKFIEVIRNEYTVWACEIVKRESIDVMEWVKANRPNWLEAPL